MSVRSWFALLLALFPRPFAERFGRELLEQLETEYRALQPLGRGRVLAFCVASTIDLVRAALAERWDPSWMEQGHDSTTNRGLGTMMTDWVIDLRHAARSLRKAPGFTAVTVGTLGLAMGATTGVFNVIDAVLLDPLPYPEPDRLVAIAASAPGSEMSEEFPISGEFYFQYQESELLAGLSTYNSYTNSLRVDDRVERVRISSPAPQLFDVLGVTPLLGRTPRPDEEDVAVISHALWTTWFGSDPSVVGRTVFAAGSNRTVIGVMGPDFWFDRDDVLIWVPVVPRAENVVLGQFTGQNQLVARLAPGVTHEALAEELTRLAANIPERFGGSASYARLISQHRAVVRSLQAYVLGNISMWLWILLGAVGIVLLIACANVANLFFVRSEHRGRDVAVRRALGAGRGRLVSSSISEAVVVAGLAGVTAAVLAWLGVPALLSAVPAMSSGGAMMALVIPRLNVVEMSGMTLLFTAVLSAGCALACGAAPAWVSSAPDLQRLREGGRGSIGGRRWARDALVVLQTALGLVLLIGSGLLVRSFQELRRVDPGYDVRDVYTFQIGVEEEDGLVDGPTFARFHMDFMDRIRALPGVESVGIVENVPLNEGVAAGRYRTEDRADDSESGVLLSYTWTGGDYFATMGIELLEGRALVDDDHAVGVGNIVVSREAASRLWPGERAIGRRLTSEANGAWYTVVGVVEDVLQYEYSGDPEPLLYLPLVGMTATSWRLTSPGYVVKTVRAAEIGPEIRAIVAEIAPSAPMYRMNTMEGLASESMTALTFTALALGLASALALILGAVGLYGVLSYVVTQRTREIGVRMALGAEAPRVRRMVVVQGARVVLLGVLIGVPIAIGVTGVLEGLLFGVEPADVTTIASMSAGMVLVGMLASYLPARRASSVDPVESLKGS